MSDFKCFIGTKEETDVQKVKVRLKNYLELDNVSVLVGAGTSYHLGAPVIRTISDDIHSLLSDNPKIKQFYGEKLSELAGGTEENAHLKVSLEDFLNFLQAERFTAEKKGKNIDKHTLLIKGIQLVLFKLCNTEEIDLHDDYKEDIKLQKNKYHYHEKMIKKLLQRSVNLRRINLFTTNYDLSFDYAYDNLGVQCINGFSGFHNRCFRPETYDYDIYYPGQTTSGKVYRAEKVIRYYKLHGSLSWEYKIPDADNWYGIEEKKLTNEMPKNELVIYPCTTKKTFALDLPYSELFRLFSHSIKQSQSVLVCVGYSFNDEHINDIIFQALSIPSFTLFIVDYSGTVNKNVNKLKELDDPRIVIIEGEYAKFTKFVSDILPDLYEEDENIQVIETINKLKPRNSNEGI